jgi:phosphoribosyl-ATP pyrophosphohydrolase
MQLDELYKRVLEKTAVQPATSQTARFLASGPDGVGRKLLEEAAESWMAAKFEDRDALALEISQVLYFAVCLLVIREVELEEVLGRL